MLPGVWTGLATILASGIANATFPLPMKYSRHWKWENTWLVFCTLALLVLPLAAASVMVGNLAAAYRGGSLTDFAPALICGFLWGTAQVTFGIGIASVGMAMAFAIVVGMCSVLGSLFPMIVQRPDDLAARPGLVLMSSAAILTCGLILYAKAARARESGGHEGGRGGHYRKGLVVCLYTGATGGAINLGFAFSGALVERVVGHGVTPQSASAAVWAVLLPAGFLPNLAYCLYLLACNRTLKTFGEETGREGLLSSAMAVLWLSGWLGYGFGATAMGAHGTSVGFAAYMTALLLWSTYLGVLTGEWKSAPAHAVRLMRISVGVIVLSVVVLSGAL